MDSQVFYKGGTIISQVSEKVTLQSEKGDAKNRFKMHYGGRVFDTERPVKVLIIGYHKKHAISYGTYSYVLQLVTINSLI